MTARALMIMGTGSDVGKSLIVAGLARAFSNRGISVAPFKPQNMSNNAAVTVDGGEIGRAQALQARAARVTPSIHMNPVLLKPESETGAQVIVQGKREATMSARAFFKARSQFMPQILESFGILARQHDVLLVEGAGSPAETNLREGDLANMGFALAAGLPVVLVGDIHRGGVIASLVGTHAVLDSADRNQIKGFIINKFHGDPELFVEGNKHIAACTGWQSLGIVPHFSAATNLPAEDAMALEQALPQKTGSYKVVVLRLPRIANFDDIDPIRLEPDVSLQFLHPGQALPACDLVIIPGSKSTFSDLGALRSNGWDIDIAAHVRRGGRVLGLCGGYQMLGRKLHDPAGLEGQSGSIDGLGLLDVETTLAAEKTVKPTVAMHVASGAAINAYEIHLGKTTGADCARPFAKMANASEGARSSDGLVEGTYLHGCFAADEFRRSYLGATSSSLNYEALIETTLEALANHLEHHLDLDALLALATPMKAI